MIKLTTINFLKKIGLYGFIKPIAFWCSPKNIGEIRDAFFLYGYNHIISNAPIYFVRKLYLRKVLGIEVGKNSFIHLGCKFYRGVKIGSNSVIGRECHILGKILIGNNVSITAQTYIFSATHDKNSSSFEAFDKEITICDYAWIGARAMILPGVKIGRGSILGASSTLTRSVPDSEIYAGCPAKKIGIRSTQLAYELNHQPYFQ